MKTTVEISFGTIISEIFNKEIFLIGDKLVDYNLTDTIRISIIDFLKNAINECINELNLWYEYHPEYLIFDKYILQSILDCNMIIKDETIIYNLGEDHECNIEIKDGFLIVNPSKFNGMIYNFCPYGI